MVKETVTIEISNGLETRPIAMLVQVASQFESTIHLENGTKNVNAKSIMGMMTLGLDNGEQVTITADGPDEKEAMKSVVEVLTKDEEGNTSQPSTGGRHTGKSSQPSTDGRHTIKIEDKMTGSSEKSSRSFFSDIQWRFTPS